MAKTMAQLLEELRAQAAATPSPESPSEVENLRNRLIYAEERVVNLLEKLDSILSLLGVPDYEKGREEIIELKQLAAGRPVDLESAFQVIQAEVEKLILDAEELKEMTDVLAMLRTLIQGAKSTRSIQDTAAKVRAQIRVSPASETDVPDWLPDPKLTESAIPKRPVSLDQVRVELVTSDMFCPKCGSGFYVKGKACSECGHKADAPSMSSLYSAPSPPVAGMWTCKNCGSQNHALEEKCGNCENPKP